MPRKTIIHPYRGFGSSTHLHLEGRVLADKRINYSPERNIFKNFANMYKRFASDEIRYARTVIKHHSDSWEVICDKEGYYLLECEKWNPRETDSGWTNISVNLLDGDNGEVIYTIDCPVLIPSSAVEVGIIADIDDTILHTGTIAKNKLAVLYHTFIHSPIQRKPVKGMPDTINKLCMVHSNRATRPLFYLSNSPWNLYNYLLDFMRMNHLPPGPILLRDFGWHMLQKKSITEKHKYRYLDLIFQFYPGLSFVLIGDISSNDADYYLEMVAKYPGRVLAIYLHQPRETRNSSRIKAMISEAGTENVFFYRDPSQLEQDAKSKGLII